MWERLRLERTDLSLALNEQSKCRRYYTTDVQSPMVEYGEQARGVDADEPVRLAAAECGFVETVIFSAVTEIIKVLSQA